MNFEVFEFRLRSAGIEATVTIAMEIWYPMSPSRRRSNVHFLRKPVAASVRNESAMGTGFKNELLVTQDCAVSDA